MRVDVRHTSEAWEAFDSEVRQLAMLPEVHAVCDLGGGANPRFDLDFLRENGLSYTLLDISAGELAKAPEGYEKVVCDLTSNENIPESAYDLVFSRMLAEHVRDGQRFHRNVFKMLKPGGLAFHFFPTLYSFPFLVNRIIPESLGERILMTINPTRSREGRDAKFPAFYRWCFGPTKSQVRRLESVGFEVEEYTAFFGHDYYRKLKPLQAAHNAWTRYLMKHPNPALTSYAFVKLRKPG